ncbi:MAG: antitoxin, RHH family protein [Aquificae bacterium]|jgi:predicted DNA-binding protein|nr:antitoxin, RHH family protein [Aquificota bacterium]
MPAKNPRISITISEELQQVLENIAKERKESLSQTARRFLELGLNLVEDVGLSKLAEERLKSFSKKDALSHEEIWD